MVYKIVVFLLVVAFFVAKGNAAGCVRRTFSADSFVCVCNATYCDETPERSPPSPPGDTFYWYISSRKGHRMDEYKGKLGVCGKNPDTLLVLDKSKTYQKIFGFGGAFTDAVGINLRKLSAATQDVVLRQYFDQRTGSKYSLCRIPIGGCDFSTRPYTYDDVDNDTKLTHFALTEEDYQYKIPYIRRAIELNPKVRFVTAAWTAPPWMKTNDEYNGFGFLKKEHYQTFANYLLKFIEEYKKNGIDIWGISTGNEPADVFAPLFRINSMGWLPHTVGEWVAENLGPTLAKSKHNDTLILAMDDQRFELPWFVDGMLRNKKAAKYVAGVAFHWYWDKMFSPGRLTETHNHHPDKFLLMTEACTGSSPFDTEKVDLGSWDRAEQYVLDIIENLTHWSIGWIDWNLALDKQGGPNWIQNYVDSPIIVNPETDEIFKQPMYYALKHFSRFVERGSTRVSITSSDDVKAIAFLTPSKETVIVLYNKETERRHVMIKDVHSGQICLHLPPKSVHTLIYTK